MEKSANKTEISSEQMETLVENFLLHQKTFKELKGITDKELEAVYSTAYSFYTHGKLDRANDLFTALCEMDPYKSKYWLGLGATRQMQKKYEKAIEAYELATFLDVKNPLPPFYAAHCLIKNQNNPRAIQALEAVIEICDNKKEHKELLSQAEQLLEALNKKTPQEKSK